MKRFFSSLLALLLLGAAYASPGAHGPNGEHLDQAAAMGSGSDSVPTMEANTEEFEIVATLLGDELSVTVDRYKTNEPVLNGKLDVEYGDIQAGSQLHPDFGDHSFTDESLLKALHRPGKHALLFTLQVGDSSDLIEGTLIVEPKAQAGGVSLPVGLAAAALAAVLAMAAIWGWKRHRRSRPNPLEIRS